MHKVYSAIIHNTTYIIYNTQFFSRFWKKAINVTDNYDDDERMLKGSNFDIDQLFFFADGCSCMIIIFWL